MEKEIAPHEKLKTDLRDKFTPNVTYVGSRVREIIMESDFKILKQPLHLPQKIKKGDVFINEKLKKQDLL